MPLDETLRILLCEHPGLSRSARKAMRRSLTLLSSFKHIVSLQVFLTGRILGEIPTSESSDALSSFEARMSGIDFVAMMYVAMRELTSQHRRTIILLYKMSSCVWEFVVGNDKIPQSSDWSIHDTVVAREYPMKLPRSRISLDLQYDSMSV
jgi:hypothetical protein